ncbi:sensor histidine kinase [Ectobacillus panaciterrae]|uniref:sensor histidine kinase n=1 Tax=Ectobacillus panaciterrae TaxID=363872 RepID=UPI000426B9E7|nr:ATP-binding protein [Ectobacillus panaciterrae]
MKKLTMVQKLWLTISSVAIITVSFLYFVSLYSYEKLYVQNVEETLTKEGKRLVAQYNSEEGIDVFSKKVADFNTLSEADILFVSNPRDLSACLPFEIQYNPIISEDDRQRLLDGEIITKSGYEPRFDRRIMGTVIPVLHDKKLVGILYSYIPLKGVKDLIFDLGFILAPLSILLIVLTAWIGRKIVIAVTKPLSQMERISYKMSEGDFTERIEIHSNDEVGRLAAAFNSMARALQKEDLQRKEFLANVSHELRTPLSYMKGYSEAIMDGVVKPDGQPKYIALIHREAGRMQRLVHDLLDLAQLEGDLFPLKKQPTVFAQLIEDELETYEPKLAEKHIVLKQDLDPGIIANIDEDRIRQVIHNIMDNAIRYTVQGGITVQLERAGSMCRMSIADSGIGIPKEHVEKLGERFYRVDKARSRQKGGTGLGLAIVKQIIEIHEGTIQIESKEGRGTKILIELPILE